MNVLLTCEHRFIASPDGSIWTPTNFDYSHWARYLEAFEAVHIVARARVSDESTQDWIRADGEGVSFTPLPYYLGPWQYLRKSIAVRGLARDALGAHDAVILRVPSTIATALETPLRKTGRPFGVEVVGDPYDVFAPGSIRHPLRPFFRFWFSRQLRRQCVRADALHYVTEKALQIRYPKKPSAFSIHYSDVELSEVDYALTSREYGSGHRDFTLITIGTLDQLYKGPDILLAAFARCLRSNLDLRLVFIGDGKYRRILERQADRLGVHGRVVFLGQLPTGKAVFQRLDSADIFVLPSRVEGLPRAMIEAMARALPCIGTNVGGIPELLDEEDLVPAGDADKLALKIIDVLSDSSRMNMMSKRNLAKAKEYDKEISRKKRQLFLESVRDLAQIWLSS